MRVAALVTGGKDSALALFHVLNLGHEVRYLVAMLPKREDSWMFHFPNIHLTSYFSEATGIPLVKAETSGIKEKEVEDLKNLLLTLDIEGVVSGAISSNYQKSRIDKVCNELNLVSLVPLWQDDDFALLQEIINLKFEVVIVGVHAHGFDKSWLGKKINQTTLAQLVELNQKYQISLVGEGGEYETLVLDAPFFDKTIQLLQVENIWENDCGYLQVRKARLVAK